MPRSIRRRRRPAWLTGAATATGGRTEVEWTADDGGAELNELLLGVEENLPEGVIYYHGLTEAAARAGLTFSGKKAVRRIVDLLERHDVVRAVGKGHLNDEPGVVVLTGTRLIFVPEDAGASAGVTDLAQHLIESVVLGKRSSGETLRITLAGRVLKISRLGHGEGHGIAKSFREVAADRERTTPNGREVHSLPEGAA